MLVSLACQAGGQDVPLESTVIPGVEFVLEFIQDERGLLSEDRASPVSVPHVTKT